MVSCQSVRGQANPFWIGMTGTHSPCSTLPRRSEHPDPPPLRDGLVCSNVQSKCHQLSQECGFCRHQAGEAHSRTRVPWEMAVSSLGHVILCKPLLPCQSPPGPGEVTLRVNFPHKAYPLSLPSVPSWPGILREMAERWSSADLALRVHTW